MGLNVLFAATQTLLPLAAVYSVTSWPHLNVPISWFVYKYR